MLFKNKNTADAETVDEFDVAAKEAEEMRKEAEDMGFTTVIKLRRPLEYNKKTYTELRFDWDSVTGRDSLAIEDELAELGKFLVLEEYNGHYLIRLAAKACTENIGFDAFELMHIHDYRKARRAARSFLLVSNLREETEETGSADNA